MTIDTEKLTEKLTEILKASGRTESLQRQVLCQEIGFEIGTMPNAMLLSENDFGKRLINILFERKLFNTLKRLCEKLDPYFYEGDYHNDLTEIEEQLNSINDNKKSEEKVEQEDVSQQQQIIQKLEAQIKNQQEEIERLKSENIQLKKAQQKVKEIEEKFQPIRLEQLAKYESGFKNLSQIIIACHEVQDPIGTPFGQAVKENFEKGIGYTFLVSNSRYKDQVNLYFNIYKEIAKLVQKQQNFIIKVENLVRIKRLQIEWDFYPYIFYKLREDENKKEKTFVYRGDDKKKGICSEYYRLDIKVAPVVYELLNYSVVDWEKEDKQKIMSIDPDEYRDIESEDLNIIDN